MKLAEALIERKAAKEKIARLRERLVENARVQEGDAPSEDPQTLLAELDAAIRELRALTIRINATNITAPIVTGERATLMEAIAERDMLALQRAAIHEVANAGKINKERGYMITRSEIKFRPTVDVATLEKQVDALAKEYRELDTRIQTRNFEVEIVE
ncbi:MAG: DIP1984 family protein [Chloroflexi bacterium]|nr:DIP1984 family protein [Chloroflexota bacterium]